jgi:glycosyltransferase involved in cell wall biosynthesis
MDRLATSADHVTSVSTYFQRIFGGTVVPQAVDTAVFDPVCFDGQKLRRQWNLEGFRVVLFLGRPLPHKGLDDILRAVELSRHANTRLVIVGGYTAYAEQLRRHERVVFLGPQPFEEGPAFLAMADVVMVPQRAGPLSVGQMPTKIPEAMAMGVPVIATAISDIPEQVGEGGLIVACGDVPALASALDRILVDPEFLARTGHAARARAVARYSFNAVRPTLHEVFQKYVND